MIKKKKQSKINYYLGLATGVLATILLFKLIPTLSSSVKGINLNLPFISKPTPTPTPDAAKLQAEIVKEVLPEKLDLGVSFRDTIVKMIEYGAIDKEKFLKLYESRGGLSGKEKEWLDKTSDEKIVVTAANSGLILNLLWPLGISNKTKVLSEGPMGTQYAKDVGNFASTGGWSVGREDGGKLFNRFNLITLTPDQEETVKEIAQNIYRPCCGNSTYFPDCNHGAAMLGFLELAVAQGMPKEEIYKKALVLNSYWFPQTYAELAMYFKAKKGISWDKVDPKEALGANYSSGQGYGAINKELQATGLLPEVKGGGGCGV
ncbi:hypothetical protein HY945_00655 [Candidatus Gottesmanbacteria bacterium]|nr:hypothetical protein [Candidatus Gottesmanbacteria bacterium]